MAKKTNKKATLTFCEILVYASLQIESEIKNWESYDGVEVIINPLKEKLSIIRDMYENETGSTL